MRGSRRTIRRTQLVLAVVFAVTMSVASPAGAEEEDELLIAGSGRGHGVGLSQWGAKGLADAGWSAAEIMTFYFTGDAHVGTLEEQLPPEHRLLGTGNPTWVNVRKAVTRVEFAAIGGPLTVCGGGMGCSMTADPGETWAIETTGSGTCRFSVDGVAVAAPGACTATVRGMSPEGTKLQLTDGGRPDLFGRGRLKVRTPNEGASFHVMIALAFEDYVRGIKEVPFSWPQAALEAQAIAARSFGAYANLLRNAQAEFTDTRREQCWCHLYSDINDQVYDGWRTELAPSADRWLAAVAATESQVVVHPSSPLFDIAQTFYSAANGGASENSEDVFITALPYLRSVPDPWTIGAVGNPYAAWEHARTEDDIATAFEVDQIDGLHVVERFDSGTPSRIDVFTRTGSVTAVEQVTGSQLSRKLGLTGRHVDTFVYGAVTPQIGDFTGDGRPDALMLLDFNEAWWVGDGQRARLAMAPWANFGDGSGWRNPALVGDFTGDGRDDAAIYNELTGRWWVGVSRPGGGFSFSSWGRHADPDQWGDAVVGDFDGDGRDDIADRNSGTGTVRVHRSGGAAFSSSSWHSFTDAPGDLVGAGDHDGDGRDDIAFLDETGRLTVLFSEATTFQARAWAKVPAATSHVSVTADVNGDGSEDVVVHDPERGIWTTAVAGDGRVAASVARWAKTRPTWSLVTAGDFDGDGDDDVAVLNPGTRWWKVLVAQSDTFVVERWVRMKSAPHLTAVFATDRNGDGDDDLLVWSEAKRKWWLLRSDGTTFVPRGIGRLLR